MPLPEFLASFEQESLWTLLFAAGASPVLRDRWASVGLLAHTALNVDGRRSKHADPSRIGPLLHGARKARPELLMAEDYMAADPRLNVRVRLGDSTVRLFPGCVERPVADVDRAHLLIDSIDDELIRTVGFGVSHVLEIGLGYADFAMEHLAENWPSEDPEPGLPLVTEAELDSALRVVRAGTPEHLVSSEELRRALEWMTCDAHESTFDIGHPQSPFGRFLRVRARSGGQPRWLPLAFIPEIVGYAVGELAETLGDSGTARFRFAQRSADAAREHLWRFTPDLVGAPDLEDGPAVSPRNVVQWVLPAGENLGLALQMISELDATATEFSEMPASLRAAQQAETEDARVPLAAGGISVPRGTTLVPVMIVSTPHHVIAPQMPSMACMSLDDLRWISTSADHELDLLNFCRDLTRSEAPETFGFEAIDYWEWWRANGKSMFSGGRSPSLMSITPHAGEAEWHRAASLTPVETALATLRLPALRDTAGVEHPGTTPVTVFRWARQERIERSGLPSQAHHSRPQLQGWSLHTGPVPVAVSAAEPSWRDPDHMQLFDRMAGAIAFGVAAIDGIWVKAHTGTDVRGYVIGLTAAESPESGPSLKLAAHRRDHKGIAHADIEVDFERFLQIADGSPEAIRDEFCIVVGELLTAAGVNTLQAAAVVAAWRAAPPTMTLDVRSSITTHNNLPPPVALDAAFVSEADRLIAERVRLQGVEPGTYTGVPAKDLDRDVLAPIALGLLGERLAAYDRDRLVTYGLEQLQQTVDQRNRMLGGISSSAKSLSLSWDPVERAAEAQAEALQLRRANEIIVEAALRIAPSGDRDLGAAAWAPILAAANAYLEATLRSERVHHQVTPSGIEISELYEIAVVPDSNPLPDDGISYALDEESLARAIIEDALDDHTPGGILDNPRASDVEEAMAQAFGASGTDIYTTLIGLAGWPIAQDGPEIAIATRDELIGGVAARTALGETQDGTARIAAAIDLLTSTSEGFNSEPWRPWLARARKKRLLVQPLPKLSDGRIAVAPHYLLASLSTYRMYLEQGLLPWTQPAAPKLLERALADFREHKNRALETDIATLLTQSGWNVIRNIKEGKADRLNLPSLSTEIDIVAGRPADPNIWLLEAKDPASVHAVPQIRGQLDDFYLDRDKKPAYATQLGRKYADLAPHATRVAEALHLPERPNGEPYEVKAAFVTRRPIPAGHVRGPFPFLTIAEISQWE